MAGILQLWRKREFIFCLSLVTGLCFGQVAVHTKALVLPILGLIMTVSITGIRGGVIQSAGGFVGPALTGLGMSYGVLGLLILALNNLLIDDRDIRTGFVMVAAIPPGIGIIPFTQILKGNTAFSMIGTIAGYLGALVLTPLIAVALLGANFVEPTKLLVVLVELIVVPLIAARIIVRAGLDERIEPARGAITNWGFFLVIYTSIGLNRDVFLGDPLTLLPAAAVAVSVTFLLGWGIELVCRRRHVDPGTISSIVLLGTMKNFGLAAGLAISFFNDRTAIAPAIVTVVSIFYLVWLMMRARRRGCGA